MVLYPSSPWTVLEGWCGLFHKFKYLIKVDLMKTTIRTLEKTFRFLHLGPGTGLESLQ